MKNAYENEARLLEKLGDPVAAAAAQQQATILATAMSMVPQPSRDLLQPPPEDDDVDGDAVYESLLHDDDVADWLEELPHRKGYAEFQDVLRTVRESDYVDRTDAAQALAAALVIAHALHRHLADLPETAKRWIKSRTATPSQPLLKDAIVAVRHVRDDSELRELWEEAGGLDSWLERVDELLDALAGTSPKTRN